MSFILPRLYAITSTELSGLSHSEQVERLAAGGARLIQLRDKTASPREFYETSLQAMTAARRLGVGIIVNDRLDVALAVGADGVHLGQEDLPPERARVLAGEGRIIGLSTHNLEQALKAESAPVDYIAVGPVFHTSTKSQPDPTVGLDLIREVRQRVSKPLVGIGGITLSRARAVIDAGADSVAVISDLLVTGDISGRASEFLRLLHQG